MNSFVGSLNYIRATGRVPETMHDNGNLWDLLLCCEAGIAESRSQISSIASGHNTANSM